MALKSCADLSSESYFTRELLDRVEKKLVDAGANSRDIRYQFLTRTDLEGVPHMLYATVEVEDEDHG